MTEQASVRLASDHSVHAHSTARSSPVSHPRASPENPCILQRTPEPKIRERPASRPSTKNAWSAQPQEHFQRLPGPRLHHRAVFQEISGMHNQSISLECPIQSIPGESLGSAQAEEDPAVPNPRVQSITREFLAGSSVTKSLGCPAPRVSPEKPKSTTIRKQSLQCPLGVFAETSWSAQPQSIPSDPLSTGLRRCCWTLAFSSPVFRGFDAALGKVSQGRVLIPWAFRALSLRNSKGF